MTTSTTTPRLAYTADGSTVAFTFNFEIADASSIAVYDGSTKKTLTTHYTVSFDSGTSGTGTVTFTSAPSASNVVTLVRDTNLARTTDFENSGAFLASTVNAEFDRLSQAVIDATDKIENRAISTAEPNTDTATMTIPDAATRANKVLGFDSSGNAEATTSASGDVTLTGSQTLTNKAIDADNNTITNLEVDNIKAATLVTESEGIGSNDNDTTLPTSAAVKDYVDTQITAEDLDITTDSGTIAIDLDSETLTVAGGTGLSSSATSNTVTLAIDSTVTTLTGSQSLTNKTIDVDNNTVSNIEVDNLKSGVLDTDLSSVSGSDDTLASAKAIKAYVDTQDAATGIGDLTATGSTLISPSNADLTLDPSGSGSIVLNANTSVTGSVTATTSIENDAIRITDNTIVGLRSNEDLIIDPAGTGEIRPGSDVKLLSNSHNFVGNVKNEDGNALQLSSTGGITLSNNVTGYGYIQTTGDDSYIQTDSIKIDAGSGVISGRRSNEDLSLQPAGTGNVILGAVKVNGTTISSDDSTKITLAENVDITGAVGITSGTITGITDLAVADGGTGASSFTANQLLLGNGSSAIAVSGALEWQAGSSTLAVTGNQTISGNLTVSGSTTTINTTNTTIEDNIIELNSGISQSLNDAGIIIERGSTGNNAAIIWDESEDEFTLGTTTATAGDKSGGISVTAGNLKVATIEATTAAITGGSITGITDLTVADGGTGASSLTDNAVLTGTGTSPITAESNLTFDGSTLAVTGNITATTSIANDAVTIDDNVITASRSNDNLVITANGTGKVMLGNQDTDTTSVGSNKVGATLLYEDLTASGGTRQYALNRIAQFKAVANTDSNSTNDRFRIQDTVQFDLNGSTYSQTSNSRGPQIQHLVEIKNTGSSTTDTLGSANGQATGIYFPGSGGAGSTINLTNAYNIRAFGLLTPASGETVNITNNYDFYSSGPTFAGSGTEAVTNHYGLFVSNNTNATNKYGVYVEGDSYINQLGGVTLQNGDVTTGAITLADNKISSNRSNDSIHIEANGTGQVELGEPFNNIRTNARYDYGVNKAYVNGSYDGATRIIANNEGIKGTLTQTTSSTNFQFMAENRTAFEMAGFSQTSANDNRGLRAKHYNVVVGNETSSNAATIGVVNPITSNLTLYTDNGNLTATSAKNYRATLEGEPTSGKTATFTNGYNYWGRGPTDLGEGGTTAGTNYYGLYIDTGSVATNNYGVWINDDAYTNKLGGVTLQNGDITASGVTITDNHISTAASNADLHIDTSGTGKIKTSAPIIGIGSGTGGNIILTDQADGSFQTSSGASPGMLSPSGLQVDSAGSYKYSQLILNNFSTNAYNALWTTRSNTNTHGTNAYLDSGDVIFQFFGAGWNGDTDGTGYFSGNTIVDLYASEAHDASNRGGGFRIKTINKGAASGATEKLRIEDHVEAHEKLEFKKNYQENIDALTSSSTITVDCSAASVFTVTLATNTGFVISNLPTGGSVTLIITQDGTGSRTATFGTDGSTAVKFAGGSKTLSTAASAIDVVTIFNDGTNYIGNLSLSYAA